MKFFAFAAAFLLICALASVQATPGHEHGGRQPQAPHHGPSGPVGHGASVGHGSSGHNVPVSHGPAPGHGAPVSHGYGHH